MLSIYLQATCETGKGGAICYTPQMRNDVWRGETILPLTSRPQLSTWTCFARPEHWSKKKKTTLFKVLSQVLSWLLHVPGMCGVLSKSSLSLVLLLRQGKKNHSQNHSSQLANRESQQRAAELNMHGLRERRNPSVTPLQPSHASFCNSQILMT